VTIHIDHFGVKNPPLFPAGYIVKVARIDAELSVGALLHRQVVIMSLCRKRMRRQFGPSSLARNDPRSG